jgi:hypothetical protein
VPKHIDIDHPAVGAGHLFIPGNADSLVAAAQMVARVPWPCWVMLAREHRLPVLLERRLADVAREIWCIGYSGTGNQLLPAALEAHVTHRDLYWLSATSGRLTVAAAELPGVQFESLPGGSLVHLVQRHLPGPWTDADRAYERLGHILGHYRGARPTDFELELSNQLHAASVHVRNNEHLGAGLVRSLAAEPIGRWPRLDRVRDFADLGEGLIRKGRGALTRREPTRGARHGPALWILDAGEVPRGTHGKAVAARTYARQAPTALIERVERGFTKVWIVLPEHAQTEWLLVMHTMASFSDDFSYTGLRGAGAIRADEVDEFAEVLWKVLSR